MNERKQIPVISASYKASGTSVQANGLGMRVMQERAYQKRGEQYLLIKSPPASGKSRALMFIALDKLQNQGLKQAIITVPEKTIGASFGDEPLSDYGFFADWNVVPEWNLCNSPGGESTKTKAVAKFLKSEDKILVCTHATFRNAFEKYGVESFENRLIAIDEFHHISENPDNKLGEHLRQIMGHDKNHIVAMTGSYFRGDAVAVLHPNDEQRFASVTYTYYEQLSGYSYLKQLDIGYYFYTGNFADEILKVLDPNEKTIIHIPNVNSRESTDKYREVDHILDKLGNWKGVDADTGFHLVETGDGRVLRVADLVDDEAAKREKVSRALRDRHQHDNRDHVDIIIALGMAKEGFDWIWCEHALTVGYRSSLTEVVQIIGRATRDAKGKSRARFTNLIAEPDASQDIVTDAVNDTLKAIAASLLMEQVIAPRFEFKSKASVGSPENGYVYCGGGYSTDECNVGFNEETGACSVEIKGLKEPKSDEGKRVCREDITELMAEFLQDQNVLQRGMFDEELVAEEITQVQAGKIIRERYPNMDEEDHEAVRQRLVATINLTQQGKRAILEAKEDAPTLNTALIDGVQQFVMDVRELDIDLIDSINPFSEAYAILAKTMSEDSLKDIARVITARKIRISPDEARSLAKRAYKFKEERKRLPELNAADPWERRLAEGVAAFQRMAREAANE